MRQRELEEAAMQPSNLWVPQRRDAGCLPVHEAGAAERTLVTVCLLMLAAACSNLVLIGPVALFPALPGVCGIVAVTFGIRGLLIVANATAGVLSLLFLVLVFIKLPAMQAICTHLEYNVQVCHQCAVQSSVEACHGDVDAEFGPRCYPVETGAVCLTRHGLADECRVAAMRMQPQPPCYCTHDIWDPSWQVECDEFHGYTNVDSKALGFFVLCCVGMWAGFRVGCCDHSEFEDSMSLSQGRRSVSAQRGNTAAELHANLVVLGSSTAKSATEQALIPLQVVDGVPGADWELQRHLHTPVGQSFEVGETRRMATNGADAAIDRAPFALTGVVVTPSDAAESPLQGTLLSISLPGADDPGSGSGNSRATARPLPVQQEQVRNSDGEWTEL